MVLQPKLLTVLPCLNLLFETPAHLEHGRFQSVIAGSRVDVGTGHSQVHGGRERRGRVPLVFQHYLRRADADEAVQMFKLRVHRSIGHGAGVQATQSENKTSDLLAQLAVYRLDIVLADEPAPSALPMKTFNHLLGESGVTFCAERKLAMRLRRQFPCSLHNEPVLLPTSGTAIRRTLEKWFQEQGVHPRVVAEYDDAALMKVAAGDGLGCFPLPTVVVDEAIARYGFQTVGQAKGCAVQFYAISAERKLTHPAVVAITSHARGALFGTATCRTKSCCGKRRKMR